MSGRHQPLEGADSPASLADLGIQLVPLQTPRCIECGESSVVMVDPDGLDLWKHGLHVQDAFPEMPPAKREQLITGTHPACWDRLFPPCDAADADECRMMREREVAGVSDTIPDCPVHS